MEVQITDSTLSYAVENFMRSIKIELNPSSTPEDRQRAHMFCETFRTHEPVSTVATVGIVLITKTEIEIVFAGLRMIEDLAKYHWATLDCRDLIKSRLMYLLENGFQHLPGQPGFLKEALARTIVEIAKREWPQLWPDFVPSLLNLGQKSLLAYIVLRRLFEDIALCQDDTNVPRKRELFQSMVAISAETVPTIFQLLCTSLEEYNANPTQINEGKCKMFFGTLLPFIELCNVDLILENNRVTLLFQLTKHPVFRTNAAECLLYLLSHRKSDRKAKEKISIACMKDVNFAPFQEAIRQDGTEQLHFIKQITDILVVIGANCQKDSASLGKFFSACETLASTEEAAATAGMAIAFHGFLRATVDSKEKDCLKDEKYSLILTSILNLMVKKLVAKTVPGEKEDLSRLKAEFCIILRLFSKIRPMYLFLSPWIVSALNDQGTLEAFQWEVLGALIDTVTSTLSHDDDNIIHLGLQHCEQAFMKYSKEENLILKSAMLSTVSGLFIFLSMAKKKTIFTAQITNLVCSILKSLFHCFTYPESERNIRRHVAALFIKLAKDNGDLFVEMFDSIHQETLKFKDKLNAMEYVSLVECLLIISNRWNNRIPQIKFIESLIIPAEWGEMAAICQSPTEFATLFSEETLYKIRPLFFRNLHIIVAIFLRVQLPTDPRNNNFTEALFELISPILPVALSLTKTMHSLILDPATAFLLDMNIPERNAFLGFVDHAATNEEVNGGQQKSFKEKLQIFIRILEDATYTILGNCGPKFGCKLYSKPPVVDVYLSYIGETSANMSDFHIRRFVKMIYKPFLLSCPLEYVGTIMIPFIQRFGTFMLNRLTSRWELIDFDSMDDDNAPSEEAEILENTTLRLLTKDYFDIIAKLLESSNTNDDIRSSACFDGGMDLDDEMVQHDHGKPHQGSNTNEIGEVGKLLLSDPICFQAIVHLCANALVWKFSQVNLRAAHCILLSMAYIGQYPDAVQGVLTVALKALTHSKDLITLDPIFKLVDAIITEYARHDRKICEIFKTWGATEEDLGNMINFNQGNVNSMVKKRKEVVKGIIKRTNSSKDNRLSSQWLTQLPSLLIYNADKAAKQEAAAKEVDLKDCFSLIHLS